MFLDLNPNASMWQEYPVPAGSGEGADRGDGSQGWCRSQSEAAHSGRSIPSRSDGSPSILADPLRGEYSTADDSSQRQAQAGPVDRQQGQPAHRARAGQSHLATSLWHGTGRNWWLLLFSGLAAHSPRASRLASPSVHRDRLVDQGNASPNFAVQHIPDGLPCR